MNVVGTGCSGGTASARKAREGRRTLLPRSGASQRMLADQL